MNEKLRNHVNILFAAAPKTAKAEEIKEELLTNLNDKYNDLLANGYDSAAAFHIALSGIGDMDELLKECGGMGYTDSSKPTATLADTWDSVKKGLARMPVSLLILLIVVLFVLMPAIVFVGGYGYPVGGRTTNNDTLWVVMMDAWFPFFRMCLLMGIALIVYAIIRSSMDGKDTRFKEYIGSNPPPAPLPVQPDVPPVVVVAPVVAPQVVRKRPLWLLLFLAFILFLIGLWINGVTQSNAPIMFVMWWTSFAMIILYVILRIVIGKEVVVYREPIPYQSPFPVTQEDILFKRIIAGLLGIFLGCFGIHKFYLGFIGTGITVLLVSVLSIGILLPVMATIGFIEGILYLLKSDRDFYCDYEIKRRNWF